MKKLLLGLLGGVTLGMLFAPEKGDKLRKKLSKSDEKLKDFGKELLVAGKGASDEVQKFINSKEVQKFLKSGKGSLEEVLEKGKKLSTKGKKEAEKIFSKLKGEKNTNSLLEDISAFFSSKK